MEGKLIKTEVNYILENDKGVIIASTSLKKKGLSLSIKNCEAIANGYDLDELAEKHYNVHIKQGHTKEDSLQRKIDFILGFQKALELLGDKKFSEEDMRRVLSAGLSIGYGRQFEIENKQVEIDSYIKSLQQTEFDVEIEMQKVKDETKIIGAVKGVKGSGNKITTYKSVPKLDAEGCLILRRI